jgi:diguanylate cyclase (GGDEF)-like protein
MPLIERFYHSENLLSIFLFQLTFTQCIDILCRAKMDKNGKGQLSRVIDEFYQLFTSSPVIFLKWANKEKWPVDYISINISRLGYRQEDFLNKEIMLADIIHEEDLQCFTTGLMDLSQNQNHEEALRGELRLITGDRDAHQLFYYTVLPPTRDDREGVEYYYGYLIELGGYQKALKEEEIEYRAYHDPLTGLPNRNLFNDRLEMEIRRTARTGQKFGVMFLDLDDFKNVNDSLGHVMGDYLLKEVGKRLLKTLRDVDTVARIGGDEFIVLLPQVADPKEIAIVAQRILEVFIDPFTIQGHEIFSTASIGICIFPTDGKDSVELLKNSDLAMYHAKEQGKNNYVFFSEKMNIQMKKRMKLETQLRHALRENQFVLHYQPLVDLKSGKMVGVEALIRWNNPQSGLIAPDDFIPIAEETGMILKLGQWVLETSCKQIFTWRKQGVRSLYMSINISSRQFFRRDFLELVQKVLKSTGLTTKSLTLQVTENGIMGNRERIVTVMKALKGIGVKLSIDDFGTGFSSLAHLRYFPVDTLKIDRSFVRGIPHDPDCVGIASSVITLAKNLKLKVMAEGVENQAQLDFLVGSGCDLVQGYYFSPPVPPEQIYRMIKEKKNLYCS